MRFFFLFIIILCVIVAAALWLSWMLIMSLPFLFSFAIVIYLVVRERRRQAEHLAVLQREAKIGRQLNEQEFYAWQGLLEDDRRQQAKRVAALKKFDDQARR